VYVCIKRSTQLNGTDSESYREDKYCRQVIFIVRCDWYIPSRDNDFPRNKQ